MDERRRTRDTKKRENKNAICDSFKIIIVTANFMLIFINEVGIIKCATEMNLQLIHIIYLSI